MVNDDTSWSTKGFPIVHWLYQGTELVVEGRSLHGVRGVELGPVGEVGVGLVHVGLARLERRLQRVHHHRRGRRGRQGHVAAANNREGLVRSQLIDHV